eukprot:1386445-Amorphochlora_amoeboformis.AAC.2
MKATSLLGALACAVVVLYIGLNSNKTLVGVAVQPKAVRGSIAAPHRAWTPVMKRHASSRCMASRRNTLEGGLIATLGALTARPSLAKAPKGFSQYKDTGDKYEFLYPFGWEEIYVKGTDILYKDIIEPLETASVTLIETDKSSITEYGDLADVSTSLAEKVLTPPGQEVKIVSAKEKDAEGRKYYVFEFTAKSRRYTRHTL